MQRSFASYVFLFLALVACSSPAAFGQDVSASGRAEQAAHGLTWTSRAEPGGIRLTVHTPTGESVAVDSARGTVTLHVAGNPRRYRYDLLPADGGNLVAPVDLTAIAGRQISVSFTILGLPGTPSKGVSLQETLTVPTNADDAQAAAIARQRICPVSGKPLGSMGEPIAVDIDGRRVFVCCAGCVATARGEPQQALSGVPQVRVMTSTADDDAAIAAQKVCPVMDEPLGSMGRPVKVMVGSQAIYLCCKGCIKKVQADPAAYASKIRVAPPPALQVVPTTTADAAAIAAQKVCPVMDEPLGSMGMPVKVVVGSQAIYLCCKGCIKKVQADPAKFLTKVQGGKNHVAAVPEGTIEAVRPGVYRVAAEDTPFIAAQKTCPVMDEPLDAMGGPYKVHVAGKAIYICCPGCQKFLAQDPDRYLQKLADAGVEAPALR